MQAKNKISCAITYPLDSSSLIQGEMHVKEKEEYHSDHTDSNLPGRHMQNKSL